MARLFTKNAEGPYRIEFAVRVWRQLDALPELSVQQVSDWLAQEAQQVSERPANALLVETFHSNLDGLDITYQVSPQRRTITLVSVAPRLPEAK